MSEKKQQTAYPLRMPQALREQLESSAVERKRSVNAEIVARLEQSFAGEPERPALSQHEAAIHTLAMLYKETLDRIADIKPSDGSRPLGEMDKIELLHEEATAKYLRHAIARAALPPEEPKKKRRKSRPLGIDPDVHAAVRTAENSPDSNK